MNTMSTIIIGNFKVNLHKGTPKLHSEYIFNKENNASKKYSICTYITLMLLIN